MRQQFGDISGEMSVYALLNVPLKSDSGSNMYKAGCVLALTAT